MMASYRKLGNVPSSSIFLKSLWRTDINSYLNVWQNSQWGHMVLDFSLWWGSLISNSVSLLVYSDCLFRLETILIVCVFLEICPLHLGYLIRYHRIVYLQFFFFSNVVNYVTSFYSNAPFFMYILKGHKSQLEGLLLDNPQTNWEPKYRIKWSKESWVHTNIPK